MMLVRFKYSQLVELFIIGICFLFSSFVLYSQGLFEEATSGNNGKKKPYELNGYLRGVLYGGKAVDTSSVKVKSGYGEASLKLKIKKKGWGDGFAEVRFRRGNEFEKKISEIVLREAYVSAYMGPVDIRMGRQVVVWGRADGINPTDNITPKNVLVRSPDEDDRREGNFLVRAYYNAHPFRLEFIWVPGYQASILPTELISLPEGVFMGASSFPGSYLKSGAWAFKLNFELASFDGSISYYNGYLPSPGLNVVSSAESNDGSGSVFLSPTAYRMQVLGFDFSTTWGSVGLRGEVAYRFPHEDYQSLVYVPHPDFFYVLGVEKEFRGDTRLIFQYVGRYVQDFSPLQGPDTSSESAFYELVLTNRLIASQQDKWSHAVFVRLGRSMLHELLDIELSGMFNFTTEEIMLRPKVIYKVADGLTFTMGGEWYSGPKGTMYSNLNVPLSSVFTELKIYF